MSGIRKLFYQQNFLTGKRKWQRIYFLVKAFPSSFAVKVFKVEK